MKALSTCLSIVFPELNVGNLQLGYSSLYPFKKISHYHHVLREERYFHR